MTLMTSLMMKRMKKTDIKACRLKFTYPQLNLTEHNCPGFKPRAVVIINQFKLSTWF